MTDATAGLPDEGSPEAAGGDDIAYADALAELEDILESLEGEDVDVDTLAARVERAAVLIRLCRSRLGSARAKVDAVVQSLEHETADGPG